MVDEVVVVEEVGVLWLAEAMCERQLDCYLYTKVMIQKKTSLEVLLLLCTVYSYILYTQSLCLLTRRSIYACHAHGYKSSILLINKEYVPSRS